MGVKASFPLDRTGKLSLFCVLTSNSCGKGRPYAHQPGVPDAPPQGQGADLLVHQESSREVSEWEGLTPGCRVLKDSVQFRSKQEHKSTDSLHFIINTS